MSLILLVLYIFHPCGQSLKDMQIYSGRVATILGKSCDSSLSTWGYIMFIYTMTSAFFSLQSKKLLRSLTYCLGFEGQLKYVSGFG